jgi:pilus assembly protein CpaC
MMGPDERFLINQIRLREPDQVMIKVTVAEVRRSVLRQLGIRNLGTWSVGPRSLSFNTADGNNAIGGSTLRLGLDNGSANTTINALDRNNALRTLAEPTLTAVSGEAASFRAGGEIPVPGPINCVNNVCTRTVEFKPYGVRLAFTPTVISEGRINLKVATVVDELDPTTGTRWADTFIPGLRNRNMETTVELPSGGSIMTAGLLQQQSGASNEGLPFLRSVPVLGMLFQSKEYQQNETELLIIAVPYIAKPDKGGAIALPTDGYILATENQAILMGRISQRYGARTDRPAPGVGFIAR